MHNMANENQTTAIATAPQIFEHEEFGALQVIMINGEPHFPSTACAKVLGYANPQEAVRTHCCSVSETLTQTQKGVRKLKVIPEGDLYRLIMRSKLPEARKFEAWVCEDVLPSIRQHGIYMTPANVEKIVTDPTFILKLATSYADACAENLRYQAKIEADRPKVQFADAVSLSNDSIPLDELAKMISQYSGDMGRTRLCRDLRETGYLMKDSEGRNIPTQKSMEMGLMVIKETHYWSYGERKLSRTARITAKGQQYFINLFAERKLKNVD